MELLRNPCILGGPQRQARGQNQTQHSSGPNRGWHCYASRAFYGAPNKGNKIRSGYLNLAFSGAKRGQNCYATPTFAGVRNKGDKIKSGYLTPAFSGAQKRVELLSKPYILGGSPTPSAGTKSQVAASPLPSREPKRGWNCYATPVFSGIRNKGNEITRGYLTPAFSRAKKRVELLCNPCILRGSQRQARGQNQKWLPQPGLLGGPKEGGIAMHSVLYRGSPAQRGGTKSGLATSPLPSRGLKRGCNGYASRAFSGVHNKGDKMRIGCLTPAFSQGQKGAELICHPCILGGPKRQARGQNLKWLPHPCVLGGPKHGGLVTETLHSRGGGGGDANHTAELTGRCLTPAFLQAKRGWNCYATCAFSGVPNTKRRNKIRSGYLTAAFSGARKRVELPRKPRILGGSPTPSAGTKSEVAASPLPSRGPKRGWSCYAYRHCKGSPTKGKKSEAATSPLPSRGSPKPNAGQESELGTSPLPSRGPKRGWACYATPAFSRVPNAKRGDKIRSGCLALAFSGAQKRAKWRHNPCILGGPQQEGQKQKC